MVVGVLRLTLSIPGSGSLKSKRMVLRKVIDKIQGRFNVSIAEVGDNDLWQRALVGVAAAGNNRRFVNEVLDKVVAAVDGLAVAPILNRETEILSFGDDLHPEGARHWEP